MPVPHGTGTVPVPCCAGTWYSHAVCTKTVPPGQGKVERDLFPVSEAGHIPMLRLAPISGTGNIPTIEPVPDWNKCFVI